MYYNNYGNPAFSSQEEQWKFERDMELRNMKRAENTMWNDAIWICLHRIMNTIKSSFR